MNGEFHAITAGMLVLKDITASGDLARGDRNFRNIALPNELKFFDDGRTVTGKVFRLRGPRRCNHLRGETTEPGRAWTTEATPGQGKARKVE